jgi:hypothetical protein
VEVRDGGVVLSTQPLAVPPQVTTLSDYEDVLTATLPPPAPDEADPLLKSDRQLAAEAAEFMCGMPTRTVVVDDPDAAGMVLLDDIRAGVISFAHVKYTDRSYF